MSARRPRARGLSRTFRVSGVVSLAGLLLTIFAGGFPRALGVLLLLFAVPVFSVSAVRHLLRGLLWRVGSRLLVSYLLVGIVPLPFLFALVLLGVAALSGQLGARRAVEAVSARVAALPHGAGAAFVTRSADEWVVVVPGKAPDAAAARLPLDDALAAAVSEETGERVRFLRGEAHRTPQGTRIDLNGGKKEKAKPAPAPPAPPGERGLLRGRWVSWFAPLPWEVREEAGASVPDERAILTVGTSIAREMTHLFAGTKLGTGEGEDTGTIALFLTKVLASLVVLVYLVAGAISAILVTRVARATRRLSQGLAAVERGDFAYRASLKGNDQLSALVDGFNDMAAHLSASVAERAQREALEHELEVARTLQRRLLPPADFAFPGLEIAADFRPAAAIGGDFYHLLPESDTRLSVVIADVSGHGLPTGIVMAAAKASLSALAATGMDAPALLTHLDAEIRQSTESRTFVTLAHLRFDLAARRVDFTNAGHLYPWVARAGGAVESVPNPARPLGVALPAAFRTVGAPVAAGDLWVLASDGIVEAVSPDGAQFGFARVEEVLRAGAGGSAAALSSRILDAWRAHTGRDEPEDDRTLLVLRVL